MFKKGTSDKLPGGRMEVFTVELTLFQNVSF
jgi:hypothetical protein